MSRDIIIDVNAIKAGTSRAPLLRNRECTRYPVFDELVKAKGDISDVLKAKMEEEITNYVQSNAPSLRDVETEGDDIDRVSRLKVESKGAFDLVQVMATALKAKRDGKKSEEIRADVQAAVKVFEDRVMEQVKLDVHRGPLVVDVDGKRLLLSNMTDLQNLPTLCPELTGEQAEYIIKMGNQSFLSDVGSAELLSGLGSQEVIGYGSDDEDLKATRSYVSIANGKVQFVSSQQFRPKVFDDNIEEIVVGGDDTIILASQVADITFLKGDKFEIGRATEEVPIKVVYSGTGMEMHSDTLKKGLKEKYISNADVALSQGNSDLNFIIETARDRGGAFVKKVQQDPKSLESKASKEEIERRENIYENLFAAKKSDRSANFLQKLGHSKEFMADRMGSEYAENTPLWGSWKGYYEVTNKLPDKDPNTHKNKFSAAVEIYSKLEPDQEKQLKYASGKVLEYASSSQNPSKQGVKEIVSPILPEGTNISEKDSEIILRAAQESKTLPWKERLAKIVDKVRISELGVAVGLASKDAAKLFTQVKAERKQKRSFVEQLNAERVQGPHPKTQSK